MKVKGPPVLDNVLCTKNSVKMVDANSIGNMSGEWTQRVILLEYLRFRMLFVFVIQSRACIKSMSQNFSRIFEYRNLK